MPLFRTTKKLATALGVKLPKDAVRAPSPEHEWFCDLFYVERKKAVIWTHRTTLLTFVRPAVTAAELREFHALFRYEVRTLLASLALPESLIGRFDVYGPEGYAPTDDRAVVGSMLDCRRMFEETVGYEGGLKRANIRALNALLSDTPMSLLGMDSAARRIRRMLEQMH